MAVIIGKNNVCSNGARLLGAQFHFAYVGVKEHYGFAVASTKPRMFL